MARRGIFLIVLSLLAVAFVAAQVLTGQSLNWQVYRTGTFSNIQESRIFEIENEGQWQNYWMKATGDSANAAPTDINFGRETVLAIHIGQRSSAGYGVVVKDIKRQRPAEVVVSIVEYIPAPGSTTAQVITSPFVIVRMPKVVGRLTYSRSKEFMPRSGVIERPDWRPSRPRECDCDCDCCRRGLCQHDEDDSDRRRRRRDRDDWNDR